MERITDMAATLCRQCAVFILLYAACSATGFGQMEQKTLMVLDFATSAAAEEWSVVNDVVMGGRSSSTLTFSGAGTAVFRGTLSLDNNGGFASVRCRPRAFQLEGFAGIRLTLRGDGKTYRLRFRMDDRFDGIAYQQRFQTTKEVWITVNLPFSDFTASFRGNNVPDLSLIHI